MGVGVGSFSRLLCPIPPRHEGGGVGGGAHKKPPLQGALFLVRFSLQWCGAPSRSRLLVRPTWKDVVQRSLMQNIKTIATSLSRHVTNHRTSKKMIIVGK